jgi:hypothetical protein
LESVLSTLPPFNNALTAGPLFTLVDYFGIRPLMTVFCQMHIKCQMRVDAWDGHIQLLDDLPPTSNDAVMAGRQALRQT